jgi:hypothetical protein
MLQPDKAMLMHHYHPKPIVYFEYTLGGVCSIGFKNLWHIHHYNIMQNSFSSLKKSPVLETAVEQSPRRLVCIVKVYPVLRQTIPPLPKTFHGLPGLWESHSHSWPWQTSPGDSGPGSLPVQTCSSTVLGLCLFFIGRTILPLTVPLSCLERSVGFFVVVVGIEVWTQSFTLARQALCHLRHTSSPWITFFFPPNDQKPHPFCSQFVPRTKKSVLYIGAAYYLLN